MTDDLDIDAIEDRNEAGGYHDQHEIRALVGEVKRLCAALAESQAGEAEWQEHANNYQGHYMREGEHCDRAEAERDARPAITQEDAAALIADNFEIIASPSLTAAMLRVWNALDEHAKGAKP